MCTEPLEPPCAALPVFVRAYLTPASFLLAVLFLSQHEMCAVRVILIIQDHSVLNEMKEFSILTILYSCLLFGAFVFQAKENLHEKLRAGLYVLVLFKVRRRMSKDGLLGFGYSDGLPCVSV